VPEGHRILTEFYLAIVDRAGSRLAELMEAVADGGPVLVHCAAGINRSGLLAAASLIREGHDVEDAIATVRAARAGALNNPEFVEALRAM